MDVGRTCSGPAGERRAPRASPPGHLLFRRWWGGVRCSGPNRLGMTNPPSLSMTRRALLLGAAGAVAVPRVRDPHVLHFMGMAPVARYAAMAAVAGLPVRRLVPSLH